MLYAIKDKPPSRGLPAGGSIIQSVNVRYSPVPNRYELEKNVMQYESKGVDTKSRNQEFRWAWV